MHAGLFRADPQIGASELRSSSPKGGPVPKFANVCKVQYDFINVQWDIYIYIHIFMHYTHTHIYIYT